MRVNTADSHGETRAFRAMRLERSEYLHRVRCERSITLLSPCWILFFIFSIFAIFSFQFVSLSLPTAHSLRGSGCLFALGIYSEWQNFALSLFLCASFKKKKNRPELILEHFPWLCFTELCNLTGNHDKFQVENNCKFTLMGFHLGFYIVFFFMYWGKLMKC